MADLIPGMTEIMDHIKKLEKENKMLNNYNEANIKLRQEKEDKIKELEEEKEKFKKAYEEKHIYSCELGDFIDKQKEENQQQQKWFEEINKLLEAEAEDPT